MPYLTQLRSTNGTEMDLSIANNCLMYVIHKRILTIRQVELIVNWRCTSFYQQLIRQEFSDRNIQLTESKYVLYKANVWAYKLMYSIGPPPS